jgi:hypothetical protein
VNLHADDLIHELPNMLYNKKSCSSGEGLFAARDILQGQQIAAFTRVLSAQGIIRDELDQNGNLLPILEGYIKDDLVPLSEQLILTLYLAVHRSSSTEQCQHAAYIASLPSILANGVWSEQDFAGTAIEAAIRSKQQAVKRQHDVLARDLCSFDDWRWAASMVQSRTIELPENEEQREAPMPGEELIETLGVPSETSVVLVPTLDLCNHAGRNHSARWEVLHQAEGVMCISLEAVKCIAQDEEITLSYGNEKANEELFFNYGFVDLVNPNLQCRVHLMQQPAAFWEEAYAMYGLPGITSLTLKAERNGLQKSQPGDDKQRLIDLPELWSPVEDDPYAVMALYLATDPSLLSKAGQLFTETKTASAWREEEHTVKAVTYIVSSLNERIDQLSKTTSTSKSVKETLLKDEVECIQLVLQRIRRSLV